MATPIDPNQNNLGQSIPASDPVPLTTASVPEAPVSATPVTATPMTDQIPSTVSSPIPVTPELSQTVSPSSPSELPPLNTTPAINPMSTATNQVASSPIQSLDEDDDEDDDDEPEQKVIEKESKNV